MRLVVILISLLTISANAFAALDKSNNKEPIEILSDTLEVFQDENKGVFTGSVKATQGEMVLYANKMILYYTTKKAADNKDNDVHNNKISRIEAYGDVSIISPKEKANGEEGVYDVNIGLVTLTKNVTLIQGENVLNGSKFVYNKFTGKGTLTSNPNNREKGRALIIPE